MKKLKEILNKLPLKTQFFISSSITIFIAVNIISFLFYYIYENARINDAHDYSRSFAQALSRMVASKSRETEDYFLEKIRGEKLFFISDFSQTVSSLVRNLK